MASAIKVIFACPKCNAVFEAVQEHSKGRGKFDCMTCHDRVHTWDGYYDFTGWVKFEKPQESRSEPGAIAVR